MQRPEDGSDVTGFGSFGNSTCKRVLDLLEPGDLRLGQVVIKRVAVVKLGVNNGSGDGGSCFGIEVWTDTAKLANMVIARFGDKTGLLYNNYTDSVYMRLDFSNIRNELNICFANHLQRSVKTMHTLSKIRVAILRQFDVFHLCGTQDLRCLVRGVASTTFVTSTSECCLSPPS